MPWSESGDDCSGNRHISFMVGPTRNGDESARDGQNFRLLSRKEAPQLELETTNATRRERGGSLEAPTDPREVGQGRIQTLPAIAGA